MKNWEIRNDPEVVRVLFAGGCHVVGYPVGEEYSFPSIATRELSNIGVNCAVERLAYVQLHHPERVARTCQEFEPHIVVLQLAHWEINNQLDQHAFLRFGMKAKSEPFVPVTHIPTVSMRRFLWRARPKQALDACLGHPLVDFRPIDGRLEHFFAHAGLESAAHVILMSTLPAADPTRAYYRRKGASVLRAAAARHNYGFVDVCSLAPSEPEPWIGRSMFFADSSHLGIAGQAAIGMSLAGYLKQRVSSWVCQG